MAHYSEMDFLFNSVNENLNMLIDNNSNFNNIFDNNKVVIYKNNRNFGGTNNIIDYLKENLNQKKGVSPSAAKNPYMALLEDFGLKSGMPGLLIKAADLAYLRDLGVYPINRMAILRRFPEGSFVYENLEDMQIQPISTVIGWIKPDANFGTIAFNETWTKTHNRFDELLAKIVQDNFKIPISSLIPIPDFAQGILFEFYKNMGLTKRSGVDDDNLNETYESYNGSNISGGGSNWGLNNIPIGDPNVLQEGPFRNPDGQNIVSNFQFELETTYEQKLLGVVDPGSAMLDILDNLYAMGTSDMTFYWGDASKAIIDAKKAATGGANDLNSWWLFVKDILTGFWTAITDLFQSVLEQTTEIFSEFKGNGVNSINSEVIINGLKALLQTILGSVIAINRFELRGSIELMTGGNVSSTPWYLTIGNPYSPWLSTNHIIVESATVETSTEMGFNDQPQRLTAKFTCRFSR